MALDPLAAAFLAVEENADLLRGHPGEDGDRGLKGDRGLRGYVGASGLRGLPGDPGLIWRGHWLASVSYAVGDAVEWEGSSYVAIRASTGERPPTSAWNLLARKGDPGPPGVPGAQGLNGTGGGASLSNATPLIEAGLGSAGVGTDASRDDHVHPELTGGGAVDSVNGQTGVVVLGLAEVLAQGNDTGGTAIGAVGETLDFMDFSGTLGPTGQVLTATIASPGEGNAQWAPKVVASDDDPGAIGGGNLWLRGVAAFPSFSIRNAANDGWTVLGPNYYDGDGELVVAQTYDQALQIFSTRLIDAATGLPYGEVVISDSAEQIIASWYDSEVEGRILSSVVLGAEMTTLQQNDANGDLASSVVLASNAAPLATGIISATGGGGSASIGPVATATTAEIQVNGLPLYTTAAAGPPGTFASLFYVDSTAVTGGTWLWDFVTAAYVRIAGVF